MSGSYCAINTCLNKLAAANLCDIAGLKTFIRGAQHSAPLIFSTATKFTSVVQNVNEMELNFRAEVRAGKMSEICALTLPDYGILSLRPVP